METNTKARRPEVAARKLRAQLWLGCALFIHCAASVLSLFFALGARDGADAWSGMFAVLAVAPLVVLVVNEYRWPSANSPASWPRRACGAAMMQVAVIAVGLGVVLPGEPAGSTGQWIGGLCAVSVLQIGPAVLASRSLRYPLSADLGEANVEILVKIRTGWPGQPRWLSQDDVVLTDRDVVMTVRPNARFKFVHRIPLARVRGIEARPAAPHDSAWFSTDDGHVYSTPPGDVVVIRLRDRVQVLPIYEAAAFAEVVGVRAARVQGRSLAEAGSDSDIATLIGGRSTRTLIESRCRPSRRDHRSLSRGP